MPFNSNMVDHPTIPIGEIKPRLVNYLNTSDPNGQIISIYRTNQPPAVELTTNVNTSLLLNFNGANNSTTFTDSSGNNRTITRTGSPIISTTDSKFSGSSAYFNGSSYITATIPGGLPASWTIEFWYKKTADSGWIFSCRPNGSCDGVDIRYDLQMTTCGSTIIGGAALELNKWYHVAFMRLNGSTVYRMIDGGLNGQGSTSNTMTTNSTFYIGGSPNGNVGYLTGYMDDFRICNSTQYDQSIINPIPNGTLQVSYVRPSREGQLIFAASTLNEVTTAKAYVSVAPQGETFWQYDALIMNMDGANNSTLLADHSKNNYSFTKFGNVKISTSTGVSNSSSLVFDGAGSFVKIPVTPFSFGTSNFTFEFWLNVDTTQTVSYPYVFGSSPYDSGGGFIIYLPGPGTGWGGTDRVYFQSSTGSNGPNLQSTSTFKGQGWKHVAITRSGSTFRLFVNGIQEGTATNSTANYTGTVPILGSSSSSGTAGSSWYKGYIDLFRVTNGACRYTSNFAAPTSFNYLKWKPTIQAPTYINTATGQAFDSNWLLYTNLV